MSIDYGTDLSCVTGISPEGRVTSDPRVLLGEACIRRLSTPRGMVIDDPDYGTDIADFLNEDLDELAMVRVRSEIRAELLKDERILDVIIVSSVFDRETRKLTIVLGVTANELAIRLTLAIGDVTTELLSVE